MSFPTRHSGWTDRFTNITLYTHTLYTHTIPYILIPYLIYSYLIYSYLLHKCLDFSAINRRNNCLAGITTVRLVTIPVQHMVAM